MDDKTFTEGVLRTESILPQDTLFPIKLLMVCFRMVANLGTIVDLIKRTVFYQKKEFTVKQKVAYLDAVSSLHADLMVLTNIQHCNPDQIVCDEVTDVSTRTIHGVVGKITEIGETCETMHRVLYNNHMTEDDRINLLEEDGDGHWYSVIECESLGSNITESKHMNNAKLQVRFPGKFSQEAVLNRDIEAEQAALRGKV